MKIELSAQNLYDLYSPEVCEKRLYLSYNGGITPPPGPFEQLLFKLGRLHERRHLETLGTYADISGGTLESRAARTLDFIKKETGVIYQGVFIGDINVEGTDVRVASIPDFLIYEPDICPPQAERKGSSCRWAVSERAAQQRWVIRDAKLARHIEKGKHPEIEGQLQIYGLLFETKTGEKPAWLEILQGDGAIVPLEYSAEAARGYLSALLGVVKKDAVPYSPVGWSKCGPCGFFGICWGEAQKNKDVALLPGVDQKLAVFLRKEGAADYEALIEKYDEATLSEIKRPHGNTMQRVGKKARGILLHAKAFKEGKSIIAGKFEYPESDNYAMFDLEGIPQYTDELEKIYLWGLKIYGKTPSGFIPALADISPDSDKEVWEKFLENCRVVFEKYGDIPFIHYASYERIKLRTYMSRYGDARGIAARVEKNLFDLLPALKNAVVMPEPSYSLKVIEKSLGFKRTQDEYGGDWAIAKYIEAVEMENEKERKEIMDQIKRYNEEDLDATWAVFQWLEKLQKGVV